MEKRNAISKESAGDSSVVDDIVDGAVERMSRGPLKTVKIVMRNKKETVR